MPDSDVRTECYGPAATLELRDSVLNVYLTSHSDQQHNAWFGPEKFWERLVDLYAPSRDFGMVAAWRDDEMIGYAFGSPRDDSQSTWSAVTETLVDIPAPSIAEPIYIFREFAVHPTYQGRGHGRLIHDSLLRTRPERLAHLLVRPDNTQASAAYSRWGWRFLEKVQPFRDSPVMDALVRTLPVE